MWKNNRISYTSRFKRGFSNRRPRYGTQLPESYFVKKAVMQEVSPIVSQASFSDFPLHERLHNNISQKGFSQPTPIQEKAIPHILEGKDVIGVANTGTGKTGAFLIPLINKTIKNPETKILVVVPTRELAQQIRQELRSFTLGIPIYSTLCIGGTPLRNQVFELRRNPHIVVGTPGRLKDLIEQKALSLSLFNTIVLDEVDRMVDMGFIQDIKYLVSLLPKERQSLFFSATIAETIKSIINSFLRNPVTVSAVTAKTSDNVDQDIVRVQNGEHKIDVLTNLLKKEDFRKVLVFTRTKIGAEKLSTSLYKKGFKSVSIHGDKPQFKRQQAIRFFKEGVATILVATDVAARGIDIPLISHVINYDQPATHEDYIHRIGRTGRANQKGYALTFV